jgi:hypothetical protein
MIRKLVVGGLITNKVPDFEHYPLRAREFPQLSCARANHLGVMPHPESLSHCEHELDLGDTDVHLLAKRRWCGFRGLSIQEDEAGWVLEHTD